MAGNDSRNDGERTHGAGERAHSSTSRDRKRDRIVEGVKSRPYAAAAAATVAAGAAAFFLSRSKSDKPLMNWGQESDTIPAGSSSDSASTKGRTLETASAAPNKNAAVGSGGTASASTTSVAGGSTTNRNTGTSNTTGAGMSPSATASGGGKAGRSTGLDDTADDQSKVGSIAYGA